MRAGQRAGALHGMQAYRQWLGHRRHAERGRFRHDEALALVRRELLLKGALDVGHDRRAAEERHPPAQIGAARLARRAAPARQARVDRDPVADLDAGHLSAGLDHLARHLVAEDQRLAHREIADPALEIVVQVRAADAAGAKAHPHLIGLQRCERPLLETKILGSVQHAHTHGLPPLKLGRRQPFDGRDRRHPEP
jgi:hypothetical protein